MSHPVYDANRAKRVAVRVISGLDNVSYEDAVTAAETLRDNGVFFDYIEQDVLIEYVMKELFYAHLDTVSRDMIEKIKAESYQAGYNDAMERALAVIDKKKEELTKP